MQTGGALQHLCRTNTVFKNLPDAASVYCLAGVNETRSEVERPPRAQPKGQGGVATVTSAEMGNYYWSYCGAAITHVRGSRLVVYMCVSACSR